MVRVTWLALLGREGGNIYSTLVWKIEVKVMKCARVLLIFVLFPVFLSFLLSPEYNLFFFSYLADSMVDFGESG